MRVLIIDDSPDMAELLGEIIGDMGCETVLANSGREALELMTKAGPFDLCLVDWKMPEMSGLEFVQAIRAQPQYEFIKLIMITGMTEMDDVVAALTAGANEYLMKPFSREMVMDKLRLCGFHIDMHSNI
ncbi:MAG: hypothetical protein ACD_73C00408G0001 [uncultured bacterium]|nr:MAG: hypothetical protein ACD_73C00408G0001 [uncultured bacterium]